MKNKISKHTLIFAFSIVLVFQILLFFNIIPYKYTWGGKLNNRQQALVLIGIAFFLNVLFLATILIKANYLKLKVSSQFLKIVLWAMVVIFGLNTIGNLFATNNLEKYMATPITLILCYLCFKLAKEE